jgi:DNA mismatch repair protein MutS
MMKQYLQLKETTPDCILFFRLGDFYEMFSDDAVLASRELNLTLTTRDRDKDSEDRIPMCGVPYHAAQTYIARLLDKGYKVAICEQTEDPALAKGLVSRDIIRVVTPGTLIESSMLEDSRSNYIGTVYLDENGGGVSFSDISTGTFDLAAFTGEEAPLHIVNELVRYAPAELLVNEAAASHPELKACFQARTRGPVQVSEGLFLSEPAREAFRQHFGAEVLNTHLGNPHVISTAGGLLSYLHETQKTALTHINTLNLYTTGQYMELDYQTRRNLELTETIRSQDKRGSLLWVLDKTKTPMGGRTLRSWLEKPLLSPAGIKRRLNAVSELSRSAVLRGELIRALKEIGDMERLIGRVSYGNANCRDVSALAASAAPLPEIKALLAPMKSSMLSELAVLDTLEDMRALILDMVCDAPPFSLREGGMIRTGFHEDVDRLRTLTENAKGEVAAIEAFERERTGIKKLKVGYNKVFGYYIEMPRSRSEQIPGDYIRKQTLVNSERFITERLKTLEAELLTARDRLCDLEYRLFTELRDQIAAMSDRIKQTASRLAALDVLCALSEVAVHSNYCMPEGDVSDTIDIRDGRHPVVEKAQTDSLFVPNDTFLNGEDARVSIITGPNMAGKSTYMRQTALIVLMAQIGSFVPARSARIGITDRIFTRVGASDDLAAGQSTFMVEMTEVAAILKNATRASLLILDEIGRGTSTYDGMAIARAVLEYCADKRTLGAKTLFATHYHELTELETILAGVRNLSTAVKKRGDDIIFLRRIVPSGADQSYGVEVAKLAGVPEPVIRRARTILQALESSAQDKNKVRYAPKDDPQLTLEDLGSHGVTEKLRSTDLNTLTPIEAMNLLYELKKELGQ